MYRITLIFNDGDERLFVEGDVASALEFAGYCIKSLKGVISVFIEKGGRKMIKLCHKGKYTDEDIAYLVAQLHIITDFGICDSTVVNCPECKHRSACLDLLRFIGYVEKLQTDVAMRNWKLTRNESSDFVK